MKTKKLKIQKKVALLLFAALLLPVNLFALSGKQIMQKNDNLPEAKSLKNSSVLVILRKSGGSLSVDEKKYFSTVAKKYGKKTRSRIKFTKPNRIEFLTHSSPGVDSLQWIKLSGGAVRKISSSDKGNPFVNSHFYYDDVASHDISDFTYTNIGSATAGDNDDDCYKVKAVKRVGTKVYSHSVIFVRKSDFVILQVNFYEKGRHTKTLYNQKIQLINGIYTPRKVVMSRTDGKGKSIIYITSVQYNVGVSDYQLKKEAL